MTLGQILPAAASIATILAFIGAIAGRILGRVERKIDQLAETLDTFRLTSAAEHTITLQRVAVVEERTRTWAPSSGSSSISSVPSPRPAPSA